MEYLEEYITQDIDKQRADIALSALFPSLSRTRIQTLIKLGFVFVNQTRLESQKKIMNVGDHIGIEIPSIEISQVFPENIPLKIIYEDDDIIVIDKPAGMVVHPAPGHYTGTLVHALLYHCGDSLQGISGVRYPGIVHRLDRYTSGLMVAAKTEHAHHHLCEQLKDRSLKRVYHAVCWGIFHDTEGVVNAPITRSPYERQKMGVTHYGKEAITHYKVLKTLKDKISLVECKLETGRTHQIRVHLTHIKHALLGDSFYGKCNKGLKDIIDYDPEIWTDYRQALHAVNLGLIHPKTGKSLFFECAYPEDLIYLLDKFN